MVVEAVGPRLSPATLLGEAPSALGGIVDFEDLADILDRDLEISQPPDRAGDVELVPAVAPIAREPIHVGRSKEVELVVVPERADREAREPGELPDRDQVLLGALGFASSPTASSWTLAQVESQAACMCPVSHLLMRVARDGAASRSTRRNHPPGAWARMKLGSDAGLEPSRTVAYHADS